MVKRRKHPPMQTHLYLLEGAGGKMTYTGITHSLWLRLKKHNSKHGKRFTRKYQPWSMLAYISGFRTRSHAASFEYFTKHQSLSRSGRYTNLPHRVFLNRLDHILMCVEKWQVKQGHAYDLVCTLKIELPANFRTVRKYVTIVTP